MDTAFARGLSLQVGNRPGANLLKHEFRAMGVGMMAALESDAPMARLSLEQVPRWFEEWEQIISHYRPDTELSRLNESEGQPVPVSTGMWEALQVALSAAEETEGIVAPASRRPGELTDRHLWRQIELDRGERTVRLPAGVRIDFEGTGKGFAADRAAASLGVAGPALVDAGGKIAVSGPMLDGSPWPIGVADPFDPDNELAVLRISSGGVATSARPATPVTLAERGSEIAQIVDPRTGQPARTDLLSVTAVGPGAVAAEVAARTVLIMGSLEGMAWLQARPELAGLMVLEDGSTLQTPNFAELVWSWQPGRIHD